MKKNFNGTVLENVVYEIFVDDDGNGVGYITYLYEEKNTNNMYIERGYYVKYPYKQNGNREYVSLKHWLNK